MLSTLQGKRGQLGVGLEILCHVCHAKKRNHNTDNTQLQNGNQIVVRRHELHTCSRIHKVADPYPPSSNPPDLQSHDISLRREFHAQHAAWQKWWKIWTCIDMYWCVLSMQLTVKRCKKWCKASIPPFLSLKELERRGAEVDAQPGFAFAESLTQLDLPGYLGLPGRCTELYRSVQRLFFLQNHAMKCTMEHRMVEVVMVSDS